MVRVMVSRKQIAVDKAVKSEVFSKFCGTTSVLQSDDDFGEKEVVFIDPVSVQHSVQDSDQLVVVDHERLNPARVGEVRIPSK